MFPRSALGHVVRPGLPHAALADSPSAWSAVAAAVVGRMGITTQSLPLGCRQIPGDCSSFRQRVLPISKASARKRGLNAMGGGLPSISTLTRNTADASDAVR